MGLPDGVAELDTGASTLCGDRVVGVGRELDVRGSKGTLLHDLSDWAYITEWHVN